MHNVRLLGFGAPLERPQRGAQDEEEAAPLAQAAAALTRVRLSFPPLPFLPSLPIQVPQLSCPSKASCEEGGAAGEAAAAEQQQQQRQPGEGEEGGEGGGAAASKA